MSRISVLNAASKALLAGSRMNEQRAEVHVVLQASLAYIYKSFEADQSGSGAQTTAVNFGRFKKHQNRTSHGTYSDFHTGSRVHYHWNPDPHGSQTVELYCGSLPDPYGYPEHHALLIDFKAVRSAPPCGGLWGLQSSYSQSGFAHTTWRKIEVFP
jgi:hypothetical protein